MHALHLFQRSPIVKGDIVMSSNALERVAGPACSIFLTQAIKDPQAICGSMQENAGVKTS